MREHLAPQARTLARDHTAPDAMLANIPVPQRERQALAAHRAVLADGNRSGSLLPGLSRPGLTGNHTSASRLLSVHRACRMTRAHARLPTRQQRVHPAAIQRLGPERAQWPGNGSAGPRASLSSVRSFHALQDFALTGGQHCRYRLFAPPASTTGPGSGWLTMRRAVIPAQRIQVAQATPAVEDCQAPSVAGS
jgi:hypothetical protein